MSRNHLAAIPRHKLNATAMSSQAGPDEEQPDRRAEAPSDRGDSPEGASLYGGLAEKAAAELDKTSSASRFKVEQTIVGLLGLATLSVCLYNIVVRFVAPSLTLEWSDEVQVYITVWAIFLVLGVVTAADRHVKADLFVGMFSGTVQKRLHIFSDVLGLAFSLLLVYYGALITWQSYAFDDLSISSLRFPLWIYMAALPVGFSLAAVHYVFRIVGHFRLRG
ncbi:TRAP-type C4-dicarboxylate transport system, small permease component [Pollutimonas bauzanensis]|uniref:TRAP transporter small permease protein n=1 Tax=Pollutimonas bauzanensis TaxID=658167 RepID=A0A1M5Q914_9BURK|nr:TRAP-type C4-dicarboxylate transport system, small permease component [Pollutimonas bauzanensis]